MTPVLHDDLREHESVEVANCCQEGVHCLGILEDDWLLVQVPYAFSTNLFRHGEQVWNKRPPFISLADDVFWIGMVPPVTL